MIKVSLTMPADELSNVSESKRLTLLACLVHTARIPVGRLRGPGIELGDHGALPVAMFTAGLMGVTACDLGTAVEGEREMVTRN